MASRRTRRPNDEDELTEPEATLGIEDDPEPEPEATLGIDLTEDPAIVANWDGLNEDPPAPKAETENGWAELVRRNSRRNAEATTNP